ncbi:MAG TPA: bacterial Ig-like domain-containing protein, partial [Bacillota bacterium]|nr:bacterial Ig-like domain-containing protein [Bacillota bacterium]
MKKLIALALSALLLFCCCSCDLLKELASDLSQSSNAPQSVASSAVSSPDESAPDESAPDESAPDESADESEAVSQTDSKTEISVDESATQASVPDMSADESEAVSKPEESVAAVMSGVIAKYIGDTLFVGSTIDKSDIKITALYSDGSTKDITSFTISPSTVKAAGNNTVTVTYSAKTTTVTVPGKAVTLAGISAKYNGSTLYVGDSIAKNDITVTASYSDGTTQKVTSFTISPSTVTAAGNNTVTVTYSGKTTTVTVPGKAVTLAGIS